MSRSKLCALALLVCSVLLLAACGSGASADGIATNETTGETGAPPAEANGTGGAAQAEAGSTVVNLEDFRVTLIGDSVVLIAVDAVGEAIPGIDIRARNDRQLAGAGLDLLKEEEAGGKLGDIVVLALGTNFLTLDDISAAMEVIGPDRQVVFVNAYRGNEDYILEVNAAIDEAAKKYPSNFIVADWYGFVTSHPDIELATDDCHLTESSALDYATVIKAAVIQAATRIKVS